ncbi:hypothetical protein FGIG_01556 [Fasciola gigantica]|uniref:Uncharacterized protein n=1 Tax=Fasciola gigantica TaxID=46835 RepID=A0A504YLB1_FASGI|nr:hypothetical protein FGIG_01556 [Fasciola gigantica]
MYDHSFKSPTEVPSMAIYLANLGELQKFTTGLNLLLVQIWVSVNAPAAYSLELSASQLSSALRFCRPRLGNFDPSIGLSIKHTEPSSNVINFTLGKLLCEGKILFGVIFDLLMNKIPINAGTSSAELHQVSFIVPTISKVNTSSSASITVGLNYGLGAVANTKTFIVEAPPPIMSTKWSFEAQQIGALDFSLYPGRLHNATLSVVDGLWTIFDLIP